MFRCDFGKLLRRLDAWANYLGISAAFGEVEADASLRWHPCRTITDQYFRELAMRNHKHAELRS